MNSFAVKKNVNILDITDNQKSCFSNLKKGSILGGVVDSISDDKAKVNISSIGKSVDVSKSLLPKNISVGHNVDFVVNNVSNNKIELDIVNAIDETDVIENADAFKGVTSKEVFESYDFVDETGKAENKTDEKTEENEVENIQTNTYRESLREVLKFENCDILSMSINELVDMLIDNNEKILEGLNLDDLSSDVSLGYLKEILIKTDEILNLSDDQIKNISLNMIKNNELLTLDNTYANVYKLNNSSIKGKNIDFDVDRFNDDIKKILSNENIECNDNNIEIAKTLIENDVDVSSDNVNKYKETINTIKNIDKDEIILNSLKNSLYGIKDVPLLNEEKVSIEVNEIRNSIDVVLNESNKLSAVVKDNNIERINLKCINEYASKIISLENESNEEKAVDVKLMLNEIRLHLTTKNAYLMYSKGINFKLEPLKSALKELKEVDKLAQKKELGSKLNEVNKDLTELSNHNLMIFKDNKEGSIKFYANLNRELKKADNEIVITNNTTKEDIEKIYDSNMIESKYTLKGEHAIAKRNVSEVLNMLDIEDSELNEKCALILSLTDKEISEENIDAIKNAEQKVNYVLNKLTPKITLGLIEDGIDITNYDIDDAIKIIDKKLQEIKIETDKQYLTDNINNSEQLYDSIAEMIVSNTISDDVKDAMLGIYKILNKIHKYSDAGLGILNYKPDEETNELNINLREIFDATKVLERKQYSSPIDVKISDAFGNIDKVVNEDKTIKAMLDNAFNNLRQKMKNNFVDIDNVASDIKEIIKNSNENVISLIKEDIKEMTLEDLKDVKEFEESKILLNENITSKENLSNNLELADDVYKISKKMQNKTFTDSDEKEHLIELRKMRNKDVKEILDEYEQTDDIYEKIVSAKQETISRIESINKVLRLTEKTNNAISTTIQINDEYTNVNIYFDTDIDTNADENSMLVSMNFDTIGEIKVDAKINNNNKSIKLNYITTNDDAKNIIRNISKEIEKTFENGYNISQISINGKPLINANNMYNRLNIKNNLLKTI